MKVDGSHLIAGHESSEGEETFQAHDPRTGLADGPHFHEATSGEVGKAARAAANAFDELATWPPPRLAELLEACADALQQVGEELVRTADRETGLGVSPRLEGELQRTTDQFRSFARMVGEGWHLEAIIDHAGDGRPDIRRMLVPVGPVAVFGASNFPLAFSVPGGDTASALAAGCPVVAKGHPSHPATSELCARALIEGARSVGAPEGTVSMIQGRTPEAGESLVLAPEIKAVGFTGSAQAGRAIHALAANRPEPIPVYAEMGSLNPVFVTSGAIRERGEQIAQGYADSMTLGVGQFCTKPGLAFVPEDEMESFLEPLVTELRANEPAPLLNAKIGRAFSERFAESSSLSHVEVLLEAESQGDGVAQSAGLLRTDLTGFLSHASLTEEHFGPASLVVSTSPDEMVDAARELPGSLTATIHALPEDVELLEPLQRELAKRVGRIIWNGFPTGVAVVAAMHHGGPHPATNNSLHTSVGMTAVRRFLRPVAFQNAPHAALPKPLWDDNPLGIRRLVDWSSSS